MFDFLPLCVRRHKKKLLFLGGVVGGITICNTYLKRKFIEWESQRTAEFCDQMKRSSHFEGTMLTCDSVFVSFAPKIRQVVCREIDVSPIVEKLNGNPPNKVQLWEQLKVLVFTQVIGEMYAQCLLCILLRVQMSILSGYAFVTRCTSSAAIEQQQKYMSHIEDFMLNGINKLLVPVKNAVAENLKSVSLSKSLKLPDVEHVITNIRNSLSLGSSKVLLDISCSLMSPGSSSFSDDSFLIEISSETKDVLECEDFNKVLEICVDSGISSIMDRISECYAFVSNSNSKDEFVNLNNFKVPLAKLIPIIHNVFNQHEASEQGAFVHSLLQLESLNNFAANIYEAFSQK